MVSPGCDLVASGSGISCAESFNGTNSEQILSKCLGDCIWGEIIACVGLFLERVPPKDLEEVKSVEL